MTSLARFAIQNVCVDKIWVRESFPVSAFPLHDGAHDEKLLASVGPSVVELYTTGARTWLSKSSQ